MDEYLCFDDVLIKPKYSEIASRKDVDVTSGHFNDIFPIISANMDTITGSDMAKAMSDYGAVGCLHRFCTIEENIRMFLDSAFIRNNTTLYPWVSIGLGKKELERAEALNAVGANTFLIDVAHGASSQTAEQAKALRELLPNAEIIAGNFSTSSSICTFIGATGDRFTVDAFKVGIGGGSSCTTRVVTGCGIPTLGSLLDCKNANVPMIADGGMRTSGDIAKALAAGASAVMLGGMLAGTHETPGEVIWEQAGGYLLDRGVKRYRGSASKESYVVQNKIAEWRSAEGDSFLVPYKGQVKHVLQQIEGGLRSAFTYVGASNLVEFKRDAELIKITSNGVKENYSHGNNDL